MKHLATQSILRLFKKKDNCIHIDSRKCNDIVSEIGTPAYIYDLSIAGKKLNMLKAALPGVIEIHYAIKANSHSEILSFFMEQGTGFDVASGGELKMLLKAGADPEHIGFAGPGKRETEIKLACISNIGSLNVESIGELELANKVGEECNKKLRVALRVNPKYELLGSGMKMGGGAKAFGLDQEIIPNVLRQFNNWPFLKFAGFHIFAGSQNLLADSIISAFEGALDAVISFLPYCPVPPTLVNLGGGFGIPYYAADKELDIEKVGYGLDAALKKRKSQLAGIRFVIETGRYLIGECGLYVCRVIYRKESRGETFLVLDGGMHHHLAASGNFGQVIKKNFPIVRPECLAWNKKEVVNLVGPLCTPLDRLGSKVELPETVPGDLVAILASGAYGFSASPRSFLGHPEPTEIVFKAITKYP